MTSDPEAQAGKPFRFNPIMNAGQAQRSSRPPICRHLIPGIEKTVKNDSGRLFRHFGADKTPY